MKLTEEQNSERCQDEMVVAFERFLTHLWRDPNAIPTQDHLTTALLDLEDGLLDVLRVAWRQRADVCANGTNDAIGVLARAQAVSVAAEFHYVNGGAS